MTFLLKNAAIALLISSTSFTALAQTAAREDVPKGWHLKDAEKDGLYGISLDKAYDFLKAKKATPVLVAVIDSGIDTLHEDLKPVLWTNPKEVPGNGKDDDGNGYVDDVHGWNFLGGKDGRNVTKDSYEAARVYHKFNERFEKLSDTAALSQADQRQYREWKRAQQNIGGDPNKGMELLFLRRTYKSFVKSDSLLQSGIGKAEYTGKDLEAFQAQTDEQRKARTALLYLFTSSDAMETSNKSMLNDFSEYLDSQEKKAEAADKAPQNYRSEIVKDNYEDINDRFYGNGNVMVDEHSAVHGTHVSGIIAAARNNGKGVDGIANNVKIMMLRAVPDGDEHDKDIALAIRYAADNGAKIINMSFGKSFSPEKAWVDSAVAYAATKGVLLVHAAGNDGENLDTTYNFPTPVFLTDSSRASNWITVGASGDPKAGGLVANFSNYGVKEVDVFAPGVRIYATVPGGNKYANLQGTSMASPVVAGVAALVKSYYPNLTAQQLKQIIEQSVVKTSLKAVNPETHQPAQLAELSVTGGIVNAYEAVKLAEQISSGKAATAPKSNDKKAF